MTTNSRHLLANSKSVNGTINIAGVCSDAVVSLCLASSKTFKYLGALHLQIFSRTSNLIKSIVSCQLSVYQYVSKPNHLIPSSIYTSLCVKKAKF